MNDSQSQARLGLIYGVAAYSWWGLVPLYFNAVKQLPPFELLAHRVLWSALLLLVVLTFFQKWPDFIRAIRNPAIIGRLALSTMFIACNWYVYIYSVLSKQAIQGALGYFILPLVNVAFGMIFFRERLRHLQVTALMLAVVGVSVMIARSGTFPWIALTLAFSFCMYGVIRKSTPVDALVGLSVETLILSPLALGFLLVQFSEEKLVFSSNGMGLDLLVTLSGIVTTVPLICYGQAVRRLKLITMGFLQYISPMIAFFIAVFTFGESFTPTYQISFAFIWLGLIVFTIDAARASGKAV